MSKGLVSGRLRLGEDDWHESASLRLCQFAIVIILVMPITGYAGFLAFEAPGARASINVTSYSEARFLTTIRQQRDFSCGSAAVATLLTHHYASPVSESVAFKYMYESGDKALIRRAGFSLLDIKRFLEYKGYRADGFRISLDKLSNVGVPAIVLINDDGYKHFIVVKGIDETHLLIGDPAKGTRYLSRERFKSMWNGIVFLIRNNRKLGEKNFHIAGKTGVIARAPLDSIIDRDGLAGIMPFSNPGRAEF